MKQFGAAHARNRDVVSLDAPPRAFTNRGTRTGAVMQLGAIRQLVADGAVRAGEITLSVTISVGASDEDTAGIEALLKQADVASIEPSIRAATGSAASSPANRAEATRPSPRQDRRPDC